LFHKSETTMTIKTNGKATSIVVNSPANTEPRALYVSAVEGISDEVSYHEK